MEKKKMYCPICAEKMKLENNVFICHHCGYTLNADTKTPSHSTNHFDYESNHTSAVPQRKIKTNRPSISWTRIIIILYFISSIIYGFIEVQKTSSTPKSTVPNTTYSENEKSNSDTDYKPNIPKSEFFIQFAEQVFQKNITDITSEELEQITSIHIYRDNNHIKTITCQLNNKQEYTISFPVIPNYDYADLSCFIGLKSLILEDNSGLLQKNDLNGLIYLQEILCDKTPAELADMLPFPEKLTKLSIQDNFFLTSLEGIEQFKNLVSLSIDGGNLKTLNGLEQLPSLKNLELLSGDRTEDFSALYQLDKLETLSIESAALKDIGFIETMPNLTSFSVKDANLLQIHALASCADSLEHLSLWHIYKVEDYQVLDTLDNLITLQLELPYSYPPISFSHMKGLTKLILRGVNDISSIATASHLQTLRLEYCSGEQLLALTNLSELENLEISNLSGYFITLEPLKQLSRLKQLTFDNCRIYDNAEGILALPNLKKFTLKNCSIGFNFQNLPENSSLETFTIENTIFLKIHSKNDAEYGQSNQENTYSLSDYSDTLKNFPNLTEVTLIGNELDNIRFAAELKKLQKLDITNNYVTDLTPLSQLTNLQTIQCSNNPIIYTEGVKANIIK